MSKPNLSCLLIGGQSLLIQCAEVWLSKGYHIVGIVSEDQNVREWSERNAIPCFDLRIEFTYELRSVAIDYLFSIANLTVLSDEILSLASRGAVNFHDGPLPCYAGLNATSWALIHRKSHHGITWHLMTNQVDRGDIVKQLLFPISKTDTAFTLNARCYEVALRCFQELVDELSVGDLRHMPQTPYGGSYVGRCKRPPAACVIDWTQSAEDIDALFRGLDFGHVANPIGLLKVRLGEQVYVVRELAYSDAATQKPGHLINIADATVEVGTRAGVIALHKLTTLEGRPISLTAAVAKAGLRTGNRLPSFDRKLSRYISELDKALCKHEPFWVTQLAGAGHLEVPYAKRRASGLSRGRIVAETLELDNSFQNIGGEMPGDSLLAVLVLYLSRLGGRTHCSIAFGYDELTHKVTGCESLFSRYVPLHVIVDERSEFASYKRLFLENVGALKRHLTYPRDLPLRHPLIRSSGLDDLMQPSVACERTQILEDYAPGVEYHDLRIVVPDDGREILWLYDSEVYDAPNIVRMHKQLSELLRDIISNGIKPLAQLSIVPSAERDQLRRWNNTRAALGGHHCIHELFEEQVRRTPDAVALRFKDQVLTYAQLNSQANRFAHHLKHAGVGPDQPVAAGLSIWLPTIAPVTAPAAAPIAAPSPP